MRNQYTKEDILEIATEEDVEFIRLQFTDILGNLKNVAITAGQLEKALNNKCMFDGSSIAGFAKIEASDMCLYPDYNSFKIFPWRPQQGKVARLICDIYSVQGEAFSGDPRNVLKRAVQKAADLGYTFQVGPELEFFLFNSDENGLPTTNTHEQAGYFDLGPIDFGENARRDIVLALEEMGFEIEASHHETAPAQHEIDFKYNEALAIADSIMTFKLAVKTIAQRHGLHATFMPKPKMGVAGSGMHINMSLSKDDVNIFEDKEGEYGLSQEAYWFMGGLIKHIKAITALSNPLVNSYKRLVPGYEAPVYIAWSAYNRSPLIRIPAPNSGGARVEFRSPDSAANPYLTLAVCLSAGLDGIINQIEPPKSVNCNIFELTEEERKQQGIEALPKTLLEAIKELEKDELIKDVLGQHVFNQYVKTKKEEWNRYCEHVSDWEQQEYLYKF